MPISNRIKFAVRAILAGVSLLALSAFVLAEGGQVTKPSKATVEKSLPSALSGDLGIDFVSKYYSRGLLQEGKGAIAQPYLNLYYQVYQGDGLLNSVTLNLGTWMSIHDQKTGARPKNSVRDWYEIDYTIGSSFVLAKNYTFTITYAEYAAPNAAFDASRNLNIDLAFNDSDYLGAFALYPHFTYLHELQGIVNNGSHGGNYYEVGVAPLLPALGPVQLSIPVNAGFGSNGLYGGNQGFGYLSAGVAATVPLTFVPSAYGAWSFNTGVTYYHLTRSLADANGRDNDWVFNGGLGVAF